MRRALVVARTFLVWAVAGMAATAVAYSLAGYALGWRGLTIMSGSMEPTMHVGDVVVAGTVPATTVLPGQVITFADPSGAKKLITHRVRSVSFVAGQARFVTQGDANTGTESWTIDAHGKVGVVERRIPKVGYVAVYARTRAGMTALLLPVIAIAILELLAIWRPPRKKAVPEAPTKPAEGRP